MEQESDPWVRSTKDSVPFLLNTKLVLKSEDFSLLLMSPKFLTEGRELGWALPIWS